MRYLIEVIGGRALLTNPEGERATYELVGTWSTMGQIRQFMIRVPADNQIVLVSPHITGGEFVVDAPDGEKRYQLQPIVKQVAQWHTLTYRRPAEAFVAWLTAAERPSQSLAPNEDMQGYLARGFGTVMVLEVDGGAWLLTDTVADDGTVLPEKAQARLINTDDTGWTGLRDIVQATIDDLLLKHRAVAVYVRSYATMPVQALPTLIAELRFEGNVALYVDSNAIWHGARG